MTPHLSPEQRQALTEHPGQPVVVIDPATSESYFLVPIGTYKLEPLLPNGYESPVPAVLDAQAAEVYTEITRRDPQILASLLAMTVELFGGEATTYDSFDPEYPTDKYPVVSVTTKLSPRDAARTELEWIDRLVALAPSGETSALVSISSNESRTVLAARQSIGVIPRKRAGGVPHGD